jgi:hypothetical protein
MGFGVISAHRLHAHRVTKLVSLVKICESLGLEAPWHASPDGERLQRRGQCLDSPGEHVSGRDRLFERTEGRS